MQKANIRMTLPEEKITPTDAPIAFLVAKDRSGTTLLQTMLDSHPHICAPMESRFLIHLMAKYHKCTQWNAQLKSEFIEDLFKEDKIRLLWEMDTDALKTRIANLPENTSYGEICKQVYVSSKSFHKKEEIKLIVDKNPLYAIMIPLIQKIYPEAQFIHLIRDYRGNVNSIRHFYKNASVGKLGMGWVMANLEIEKVKREHPQKFITIRYEDLLEKPEEELERLTTFFRLSFHPDMLSYHERISSAIVGYIDRAPNEEVRRVRQIGIASVHKNLSKPIDSSLKDKWKENLSFSDVNILEKCCGGYAEKFGYFFSNGIHKKNMKIPFSLRFEREKLRLYYRLPIWFRELKSKPSIPFIPKQ